MWLLHCSSFFHAGCLLTQGHGKEIYFLTYCDVEFTGSHETFLIKMIVFMGTPPPFFMTRSSSQSTTSCQLVGGGYTPEHATTFSFTGFLMPYIRLIIGTLYQLPHRRLDKYRCHCRLMSWRRTQPVPLLLGELHTCWMYLDLSCVVPFIHVLVHQLCRQQ